MAILEGYKEFPIQHGGILLFKESALTLVDKMSGVPTPYEQEEMWANIYRIGDGTIHLIYYGEDILGKTYIRFASSLEDAKQIANNWIENWEI